jgi:antitoxin component of RelBE/YafQ-DinJ toxin-antitoxin module
MLKCSPPTKVEDEIRQQAAALGMPITQCLNPFLAKIAEGRIKMVPQT